MLDIISIVLGYWVFGTFIATLIIWLKTGREDSIGSAIRATVWPYLLIRAISRATRSEKGRDETPHPSRLDQGTNSEASRHLESWTNFEFLPHDIVRKAAIFGRHDFDVVTSKQDPSYIYVEILGPLYRAAQRDPRRFLNELADALVPVGGWAAYGGSHLVKEVLSGDLGDPSYHRLLDSSLTFLRSCGVPISRLNYYEKSYWAVNSSEPWLEHRAVPGESEARITPLGPGERRRVITLDSRIESNLVFVRKAGPNLFAASINHSNNDSARSREEIDYKACDSLYRLYVELGQAFETPTYWYHAELDPFFVLPPPRLPSV